MKQSVFRMYDVRGIVGSELCLEQVYDFGRALAAYFIRKNTHFKCVALGADGRIHSPLLRAELERAFVDSGIDVEFIGWCPSPLLYFSLHNRSVDGGVMITASHNGKEYNGFKICLGTESVWGDELQEVARIFNQREYVVPFRVGVVKDASILDEYVAFMRSHFADLIGMSIPCVIDCGNGAAGYVLPALIKVLELQDVQLLYPEVDGTYPNHDADPTVEENMRDAARLLKCGDLQFGLGLDGDCDRLAAMTREGALISGDKLLAVFAQDLCATIQNAIIVADSKCSSGLAELIDSWNAHLIVSPSGHSIIKQCMKDRTAHLAGELSGHFFFKDAYYGYDDGIYAALRLMRIILGSRKSLDELVSIFPQRYSTHEIRLDMPSDDAWQVVEAIAHHFSCQPATAVWRLDGVRVEQPHGWGLVRPSNTQPVICLRFESHSRDGLAQIATQVTHFLPHDVKEAALCQIQRCL